MPENTPSQPNSNPNGYDPAQTSLQWMQQQLAEQGINVSPDDALKLFLQKFTRDAECGIQQDLAGQGIDVYPEEAVFIYRLQFYHRLLKRTGSTDPHDAT